MAFVQWDSNGCLIDCFGSKFNSPCLVLVAEVLVVREACIFCIKGGLSGVCLESDSSGVVSWCIKSDGVPPWEIAAVVSDIQVLASRGDLSFSAVRRSVDEVANWAAKFCLANGGWSINFCCLPLCLKALILSNSESSL